jgi:hypothetical protein
MPATYVHKNLGHNIAFCPWCIKKLWAKGDLLQLLSVQCALKNLLIIGKSGFTSTSFKLSAGA